MAFPEYADIEEPLLCFIYLRGGPGHDVAASDSYRPLADYFGLSELERKQPREDRDEPLWNNMVQWARRKLNDNGYLAASRHGRWKLSDAGIAAAKRCSDKYATRWRP